MVNNNNGVPIEAQKPFETVYELKDEHKVPSYEEFMKGYENDEGLENVYYDEFNYYGNIGIPKVYGPGEEWDWLKITCPAKGCPDTSKECRNWVHKRESCRNPISYMKWSTEARIKCSYCDNPSHVSNWTFKCHRHNEFLPYDGTRFNRAISIAMRAKNNISEDFGNKLLDYLEDHPY